MTLFAALPLPVAGAAEERSVEAVPLYRNPITNEVDDTGQNDTLGQSMTEDMVKAPATLLIDDAGNVFFTFRVGLVDQFDDLRVEILDAAGKVKEPVAYSIVSEDKAAHERELRVQVPGEDFVLRASLYALPMDREVVFFLTCTKEGEARPIAIVPADDSPENPDGITAYDFGSQEQTATAISDAARQKLLLFLGIAGGAIVVIAGVGFVIYRRKKNQ